MAKAQKRVIDRISGPDLVAYVEGELKNLRTLAEVASDFVHEDGRPVNHNTLRNRLRHAEPDIVIEYRQTGVLLRHRRMTPASI